MSYINNIETPQGSQYDIHSVGIPSGEVDSTSTSTVFTATIPGITELTEGVCVFLRNGVVTSASGFTLNVNGLGAKPCYSNLATGNEGTPTAATRDTTIFNINYTMLFVYTELVYGVTGGAWICYRGYDANTNTIGYQLRTNSGNLEASDTGYRYRLWFTSADGKKWVPANTSTATNATTTRTMNTRPINPFGPIVYNSTNGTTNAGARPPVTTLWQQYALTIGYSYVISLTAWDPVYVQCTPQTDGSAVMNAIVKALPTSNDGKIYIYLGMAYSTSSMELRTEHPVFYHDGNGIKLWTGTKIPSKTSELTNDSGFITSADVPEGATASTTVPKMDGTAAVGTETAFARGDHVHPTDTTRASTATFSTSVNGLVPKPNSAATNSYLNSSGTWTTPPNTTYSTFSTSSDGLVPHPSAASTASLLNSSGTWTALPSSVSEFTNDAGYITGMTILSYGSSTLADFQAAYQANKVVYARASSNANPASGDQTRLAFMAYVNNATTPSCVEFQYYRSVSSHTSTQQGDQVFVYTLKNTGWSVTTREASVEVVAGSNMLSTYSNNTITLNPSLATTAAAGIVKPDGTTITVDSNGVISSSGGGGGSTPLIGTTATVTPTQVKTALRAGTDICIEYHGAFDQIPVDFRFTNWNGATDDVTGGLLDAVVSQTIVWYNDNYYLFNLTGIIAGGSATNLWTLNQAALDTDGGSAGFTYITENINYGSVLLGDTTDNAATGISSIAEGGLTSAQGDYSHAQGYHSYASNDSAHAEGNHTTASGLYSHAEGAGSSASGEVSHAECYGTTAAGSYSHSEGIQTLASGLESHAEGCNTTASGLYSHSEGYYTLASTDATHAGGSYSQSNHINSFAHGNNVLTNHENQTVVGQYNSTASSDGDNLFIVGNGSSTAARSNAFSVHTDGRATAGANATGLKDLVTLDQLVPVGSIIRNNISDENVMNTLYPNMTWVNKYSLFNGEQDWPTSNNLSGSYKEIIVPAYMGVIGTGASDGLNFTITIPGLKDSGITANDLDVWAEGNTGVIGRFIDTERYYIYKKKSGVVSFTIKYVDGDNVGLCTGSTANFTITNSSGGSGTAVTKHHGGTCWLYTSSNDPSIRFEISSSYDLGMYIWKRTS